MLPQTLDSLDWFLAVYIGSAVMALGLTLLVEMAVALAMGWRTGHDLAGVAAVSVMTNPFFVLSVYVLLPIFKSLTPLPLVLFMVVLGIFMRASKRLSMSTLEESFGASGAPCWRSGACRIMSTCW